MKKKILATLSLVISLMSLSPQIANAEVVEPLVLHSHEIDFGNNPDIMPYAYSCVGNYIHNSKLYYTGFAYATSPTQYQVFCYYCRQDERFVTTPPY